MEKTIQYLIILFDNNLARKYLNDQHKYHKALLNIGISGVVSRAGITIT